MNKVIIDRSIWVNGRYFNKESRLLNIRGQRCCLGFLGQVCGLKDSSAINVSRPMFVQAAWPKKLFDVVFNEPHTYSAESILIALNDYDDIDDDIREAWIYEGFKTVLDYEVEFVGEYPE
jgi:hypothetical protein